MGKKGGSSNAAVGYTYFMTVQMMLARGPIDGLFEINIGGRSAWTGSVGDSGTTVQIYNPDLFGGPTGEGGITGTFEFWQGEDDQPLSPYMINALGTEVQPAYRGVASMVYTGVISVNTPYPKTWKMRVRRAVRGWDANWVTTLDDSSGPYVAGQSWYPEKALIAVTISGIEIVNPDLTSPRLTPEEIELLPEYIEQNGVVGAMNPAHILVECLTNLQWGRGLPGDNLDYASFTAAANTLCDEGFGLCLRFDRASSSVADFCQTVINHIGAALYTNRVTGKLVLKLLRADYDVSTLPVFTYGSGLLSVADDQSTTTDLSYNEVIVTYHEQLEDLDRQVRVQNNGAIQAMGVTYNTTKSYLGIPSFQLAARVAQRELAMAAGGLKRFTLKMDRRAWLLNPGDVMVVTIPDRGISEMVLRVGDVDDGILTDGTITVRAVQDVFGLPDAVYVTQQTSLYQPPAVTPRAPSKRAVQEGDYRTLYKTLTAAQLAAVPPDLGAIMTIAAKPLNTVSKNYRIATHTGTTPYEDTYNSPWTPYALLALTVDEEVTSLPIEGLTDTTAAFLQTYKGAAVIDGEMVAVLSYSAPTLTVKRGCVDTIPIKHGVNAIVWFFDGAVGTDAIEYSPGETVFVKLRTNTSVGELDLALAPEDTVNIVARQYRPYVMAGLQVNEMPWYSPGLLHGDTSFSWSERNRVVQMDALYGSTDPTITPEVGQTYTVRVYQATTLLQTYSGITGTSWTYTEAMDNANNNPNVTVFELEAERDGVASYMLYRVTMLRADANGFNFNFDNDFDGGYGGNAPVFDYDFDHNYGA